MKNLYCLFCCLLFVSTGFSQAIIYQEKFDGMPSYSLVGWDNSFTGAVSWQCGLPYQMGSCMVPLGAMGENGGTNKVAGIAECGGFNYNNSNVLTATPPISLRTATGAWLKYDSYFVTYTNRGDTEKATVEISTDSGTTWTVIEQVSQSVPLGLFETHYIDLSAYNGFADIRIGFRYNDGGGHMMGWAIDNVTVFTPAHHDIALVSVTPTDPLLSYQAVGRAFVHQASIYNNGLDTIHSFDQSYQQDAGLVVTDHYTGLNLPHFATATFTHSIPDTITTTGTHTVRCWVSLSGDTNPANDSSTKQVQGVDFMPAKRLTIESGEGTYNGWSPRNMHYLQSIPGSDRQATLISIHEADPMTVVPYHDFMFQFGWNYIPYLIFDRRSKIHQDSFFHYFDIQSKYFGFADIELNTSLAGQQLTVNATIRPAIEMEGDFRLALVLTEDGLSGTTPEWAQVNNFAYNAYGPMGGFETMPNPIPAGSISYNFVARAAIPAPDGQPGCLPGTLHVGESYAYSFVTTVNENWNASKLSAKVLFINNSDSSILNSNEMSQYVKVADVPVPNINFALYPNPAREMTAVYFDLPRPETIGITLTDMAGRVLYSFPATTYPKGKNHCQLTTEELSQGLYFVTLLSGDGQKTLKLEIVR